MYKLALCLIVAVMLFLSGMGSLDISDSLVQSLFMGPILTFVILSAISLPICVLAKTERIRTHVEELFLIETENEKKIYVWTAKKDDKTIYLFRLKSAPKKLTCSNHSYFDDTYLTYLAEGGDSDVKRGFLYKIEEVYKTPVLNKLFFTFGRKYELVVPQGGVKAAGLMNLPC
jgi:hypothetical protein